MSYDYLKGKEDVVYRFDNSLDSQPDLMVFDDN